MSIQKTYTKKRGQLFSSAIFTGLAIGFTMISVYSQFKFYKILFGLVTAVLISAVLEITRIASLFKFLHTKSTKTAATITMGAYILTAGVSAWGAINSFTTEVIQKEMENRFEETEQMHLIKTAYSRKIAGKLAEIKREISRLQTATAKYPKSKYWQNRMSQQVTARHDLITRREAFLNEQLKSEDTEKWIQANAAKLGLKIERPSRAKKSLKSVALALKELWGIEAGTAKKIIGIVITLTVEAGILILAFLGVAERKTERVTDVTGVTEKVTPQFDDEHVAKFIEASREHFKETGELLPMRKLTSNLRPIRKFFEGLDQEEQKNYFDA
jgi:hypothetical protein